MTDAIATLDHALANAYMSLVDAERALTELAITMPAEQVPPALLALTNLDGATGRLRATLEARATADHLREWTDPATGIVYEFDGTHKRVVKDVNGLHDALSEVGVQTSDMAAIFRMKREVLFTRLNELAEHDETIRDIRDDFAQWSNGPRHLKVKEEKR
jgi:hypothetical protein